MSIVAGMTSSASWKVYMLLNSLFHDYSGWVAEWGDYSKIRLNSANFVKLRLGNKIRVV